jgi:glycosyltransferase involved in cell wall biosynthesis
MYNCAPQIGRVLRQFTDEIQGRIAKIVIIDNQSTDGGPQVAEQIARTLQGTEVAILRNDQNYGLGGSHKVAFIHAIDHGYDYVVVLHGDDQGSIADLMPLLDQGAHQDVDCLLGARFMRGSHLSGYSAFRTFGNRIFNLLFSVATGRRLFDLGSGLNLYAVSALSSRMWLTFPDDLTFNYYMILASTAKKWRIRFFPLTWREEDQHSNVKLIRQAWKVLGILATFVCATSRFLTADWRAAPGRAYSATELYAHLPPTKAAARGSV